MVHDAVGIDDVEGVVSEGEIFGVGEAEVGSEAREFASAAGAVKRSLGEIDAGGEGSGFEPLFSKGIELPCGMECFGCDAACFNCDAWGVSQSSRMDLWKTT